MVECMLDVSFPIVMKGFKFSVLKFFDRSDWPKAILKNHVLVIMTVVPPLLSENSLVASACHCNGWLVVTMQNSITPVFFSVPLFDAHDTDGLIFRKIVIGVLVGLCEKHECQC